MMLHHKITGQGFPIVILHGLFGSLDNWMSIAKHLADAGFMPVMLDLRDHGKSPHTDAINYPIMAEDVYHFMESNWIYEAIILGHSMGGKVAMTLTDLYPQVVSKLIVADISPRKYLEGHSNEFDALFSLDLTKLESRKEAEEHLNKTLKNPDTVQFFLKNLARKPENNFEWKFNLSLLYSHYPHILDAVHFHNEVKTPTLFLKGGRSPYIQVEDETLIYKCFRQVEIQTIPNVGHWLHAEAPNAFLKAVLNFIED
ncbi:MAG: alpha/beta fold hydrolase [Saprospiraceae bacterium]